MQTIRILYKTSCKAFYLHPISFLAITNSIIILHDSTSNKYEEKLSFIILKAAESLKIFSPN
jgi:hypothetical protein